MRMTQAELAKRAGVTPSFISQLESDKREASGSTLKKIVGVLGVHSLASFFHEVERGSNPVHRKAERVPMVGPNEPVKLHYLGPRHENFGLCAMLVEMQPGFEAAPQAEEDSDAFLYVLEGKLGITLNGEDYEISAGDICFIAAGSSHQTRNLSAGVTRALFAGTCDRNGSLGRGVRGRQASVFGAENRRRRAATGSKTI
jgi:HTH-type transcriptional repressor of puuD